MPDHARSEDAEVQRQLDRLAALSPGRDTLGLERITELLDRLGRPHRGLPPVFHVAGTNGKGSACAYLRAAIEAAGLAAHVYTSPHLVRFNERIRLAGSLIEDTLLAALLAEVLDAADDIGPSFFEATTAAAFLAFARKPADACIVEVGLGGRLDATNAIDRPLICGVAGLGIDHEAFLLAEEQEVPTDAMERIAFEKAGIAKRGAALVTQKYPEGLAARVEEVAASRGAEWIARGRDWDGAVYRRELHYRDSEGKLRLPLPRLAGEHQADNALLAVAMLRHQQRLAIPDAALKAAMGWADWPARLQRLEPGPLKDLLPPEIDLWLDGGHNPLAAEAVARHFEGAPDLRLVAGLLANKNPQGLLAPFEGLARSAVFVPVPDHEFHAPEALAQIANALGIAAAAAESVEDALAALADGLGGDSVVLILGSLYLAGEVLRANGQIPE